MTATPAQNDWIERFLGVPAPRLDPAPPAPNDAADDQLPLEQRINRCAQTPAVVQAAARVLRGAAAAEPALTKAIGDTTQKLGGAMIGLDYRLKSPESLARKIATDMVKTGLTAEEATGGISDAVRYTSCFEAELYTKGTVAVLDELKENRNSIKKLKNAWLKDIPYKGINVQLFDPERQVFELQFHTPRSFKAKDEETHQIYEKMRLLDPASAEWDALNRQQMAIFQQVPRPEGVETIEEI